MTQNCIELHRRPDPASPDADPVMIVVSGKDVSDAALESLRLSAVQAFGDVEHSRIYPLPATPNVQEDDYVSGN